MTGYQETLTDPSYAGQIVLQTAPHIGNTGMNDEDPESRRIWVSGYIVRDPSRVVSNWRADESLDDALVSDGVVGISGIDTRAVTRHIRSAGQHARRESSPGMPQPSSAEEQLRHRPRGAADGGAEPVRRGVGAAAEVTAATAERIGNLAVLDLGVKQVDDRQPRRTRLRRARAAAGRHDRRLRAIDPVAVFYSNGPGDPAASGDHVELLRVVLDDGLPFFGICFGNQLLGRALGLGTYKLPFGHRGINQPVLDKTTGRVEITAHNHGFAVEAPIEGEFDSPNGYGRVEVSHVGLNDDVVEGLRALDIPAFSVQYHPEAAAGPHDANYLFDRFRTWSSRPQEGQRVMPKRDDIKSVLVIGSGPIVIGQACEFDYSGTQACRVLREEGVRVILVNSNPATIMTDPDFADATYIEPITWQVIETIIAKEKPDAILPTLGGQTALNAAIDLHNHGILEKYDVELIGASFEAINKGEDRQIFKQLVLDAGADVAASRIAHSMDEVPRRRRRARLPARRASVVHDGRTRLGLRVRRERPAPHRRRGPARLAHHTRCCSRSRSSGGRSTSSSSCATRPTTRSWSARSRTSTRSACTPATRSPSRPRSRSPTASTRSSATSASTSSAPSASTPAAATSSSPSTRRPAASS